MSVIQGTRARQLGILLDGTPGKWNSITDVRGVEVGYATLISGSGNLRIGRGPVRTGVTAVLPHGKKFDPVFAASYVLNGNGEMTGTAWIEESGFLESPILITNTHSVGVVRDAAVEWMIGHKWYAPAAKDVFWLLPVVAETYDGCLNDVNGFHVKKEHVFNALDRAVSGPIKEGNVGGGTGMICHGYKGGTGTASRKLSKKDGGYTVGVLVQANHGIKSNLVIAGVPLGKELSVASPAWNKRREGMGSVVVVVATDAPLLPHQLKRLVQRVPMGLAKVGGIGENTSGDFFIGFSTANSRAYGRKGIRNVEMLPNDEMTPLFEAVIQSTEESILNSLFMAETMVGINGHTVEKIPVARVLHVMKKFHRIVS